MIARGHVKDGVVVLNGNVELWEGEEVTVHMLRPSNVKGHSILDIPTVSVGAILRPLTSEDDLLGEMLEGRFGELPEEKP